MSIKAFIIVPSGLVTICIVKFSVAMGTHAQVENIDTIWKHLSGPLGVLFGELLTIIVLAYVLKHVYREKEKLQERLLKQKDDHIADLNREVDRLTDNLHNR